MRHSTAFCSTLLAATGVVAASLLAAFPAHAIGPVTPDVSITGGDSASGYVAVNAVVTVPTGVCSIDWSVTGGSGMRGFPGYTNLTGRGALLQGTAPATAGTTYVIEAGGSGQIGSTTGRGGGNSPMGRGGAASVVRLSTDASPLAIAGGGGGNGSGGDGGDAGAAGTPSPHGGGGATTTAPGTAGTTNSGTNLPGSAGNGGASSNAGAGGGGLFGGGGAGYGLGFGPFGGGGGGSSLVPTGWTSGFGQRDTPGAVTATYGLCAAPGVATGVQATAIDGSSATVSFVAPAATGASVTGYSVSTDDGVTWAPFTTTTSAGRETGTVQGLTAGTYSVRVRTTYSVPSIAVTVADGTAGTTPSTAGSAPASLVVPVVPPGTPTGVTATAGRSSVAVVWTAPSSGAPVDRYVVTRQPGGVVCTTTTTTCVFGGEADTAYSFTVVAETAAGLRGADATATSGLVTAPLVPADPPANASLTLTTDKGIVSSVDPGQQLTVIGTGFAAFSTATIVLYPSAVVLGSVVTDASGAFSRQVTIPSGLASGQYSVLAYGADPQGQPRSLRMNVQARYGLAVTGQELSPVGLLGLPLVAAGGFLVLLDRRRRRRRSTVCDTDDGV